MGRRGMGIGIALAAVALFAAPVMAQQSNEELKKELDSLKKEVDALKQDKAAPPAAEAPKAEMKLGDNETVLDILMRETKINGFVDAGFVFNLDRPNNQTNGNLANIPGYDGSVRAFDRKSRNFYLHNAQLEMTRAATKELITGYNIQLSFGSDANVFGATPSNLTDFFDVQEANIQILAPLGNGLDIRVGKFVTNAGGEVIESKDNYNYSRSLPFLFAIPFTHTGVRATYAFDAESKYSVTLGVNNGWDLIEDTNDGKTLEFQFYANPTPWLKFYANFYYGAEKPEAASPSSRDDGDKRMLVDLVATISNIPGLEKLSAYINVDIGEEEASSVSGTAGDDADWMGFALAAKYQFNDTWAASIRYSMLDDKEAFRTGGFTPLVGPLTEIKISEITLTVEYRISKDTITRLEYRMDMCDEDIFLDKSKADDSQSTLAAEVILIF